MPKFISNPLAVVFTLFISPSLFAERIAESKSQEPFFSKIDFSRAARPQKTMNLSTESRNKNLDLKALHNCVIRDAHGSMNIDVTDQKGNHVLYGSGFPKDLVPQENLKPGFQNSVQSVYQNIRSTWSAKYRKGILIVEITTSAAGNAIQRQKIEIKTNSSVLNAEQVKVTSWQGANENDASTLVCNEPVFG